MNLLSLLSAALEANRDRAVVSSPQGTTTGGELLASTSGLAGQLTQVNASRVAYVGGNGPELPTAFLASLWSGVPFMPLNYRLPIDRLRTLLEGHPGAAVIGDNAVAKQLEGPGLLHVPTDAAAPEVEQRRWVDDPDAIALLLHTSGTTSAPKAVVLRHRHLAAYLLDAVQLLGAQDESALISVPPYHIAGMANLITNLFAGRRIVYLDRFDPATWLEQVRSRDVTRTMVVPTMLARVVEQLDTTDQFAPPCLKTLSYGGARTSRTVLERALHRFPHTDFVNAYGLTETSSTIAVLGPEDHDAARRGDPQARSRLDSAGRVLPGVEVRIWRAGAELPPGELGEIQVRGPQVSGEYLGEGTSGLEDGWFPTRDHGWLDEDGYLFVEGRGDDTIIRGGENIFPDEIEEVLRQHPAVDDVAVVGKPDEEWGEVIEAAVLANQLVPAEELRAFCRQQLRSAKTPDTFHFVEELPYSTIGKLQRSRVRRMLRDDSEGPTR